MGIQLEVTSLGEWSAWTPFLGLGKGKTKGKEKGKNLLSFAKDNICKTTTKDELIHST